MIEATTTDEITDAVEAILRDLAASDSSVAAFLGGEYQTAPEIDADANTQHAEDDVSDDADSTWIYRCTKLHARSPLFGFENENKNNSSSYCAAVIVDPCGRYTCKQKNCKRCSNTKGRKIGKNIYNRTDNASAYYHITLTLPESSSAPESQIRTLFKSLAKLKRRACWTKSFVGGYRKVEVGRDRVSGLWSCHLHVFAKVKGGVDVSIFAPDISYAWAEMTGATDNDFSPIDSDEYRRNAAYYVAKPPHHALFDAPEDLAEFIRTTKGMRLNATAFGSYRGEPLQPRRGQIGQRPRDTQLSAPALSTHTAPPASSDAVETPTQNPTHRQPYVDNADVATLDGSERPRRPSDDPIAIMGVCRAMEGHGVGVDTRFGSFWGPSDNG
jgi:hypothetical protein